MAAPSAPRPPRPRKEPQPLVIPRSAAEEQRLRLERLMRNPEKTVPIPEKLNEWAPRPPPEFVRDVMGKDTIPQLTLGSATLNLGKCLTEKARDGFLLLLILLEKRGMKCASRVDFPSFIWFLGSSFLLIVRMQSEQCLCHSSTWTVCSEISCCSGDDKVSLSFAWI
uniref:Uncharacterized protein n=1 Tax=Otus sunia TaxID=257818 RepID=A0A8C8BGG0_9STRI